MTFESRVFKLAKDIDHPDENQDAARSDSQQGIAVIADGVSSGIFSRQWAQILTEAILNEPFNPLDNEALADWLARCRQTWNDSIDTSGLSWFQKPKLREGAFSTLLWVQFLPPLPEEENTLRLHGFAVGDSCLFLVRDGQIEKSFPVQSAAELEADPVVLGSVDLNRDGAIEFLELNETCRPDDLIVLCTDAVADWALRLQESGDPPNWGDYWFLDEDAWQQEVVALRSENRMRYDDATLLLLRLTKVKPEPEGPRSGPPPLPPVDELPEWTEKLKDVSEQVTEQVTEGLSWGLKKIKEAKEKAEAKLKEYREKHPSDDESTSRNPNGNSEEKGDRRAY